MRRNWLQYYMNKAGLSASQLGRQSGINRQTISKLAAGQRGLTQKWADIFAPFLDATPAQLLFGPGAGGGEGGGAGFAPVRGEVAEDRWFGKERFDSTRYEPAPVIPNRFPGLEQFAYIMVGSSMDKMKIEDGDLLICVPYDVARSIPQSNDVVIAELKRDSLIERICRLLVITKDAYELQTSSSDPSFADSIVIPFTDHDEWRTADGAIVSIIALAIGRYRPLTTIG